ncbi:hypothetical protein BX281_3008 [Streptomyces sp. Ag82_O1-15]|nr:hypothetical protein BX281_3008 [Streptomyces sp. Ag82_O1-15]
MVSLRPINDRNHKPTEIAITLSAQDLCGGVCSEQR